MKQRKKMKTYKEIFSSNGIAAIFAANYPTDFAAFFDGKTAAEIDLYVMHKYGEKTVYYIDVDENNAPQIVSVFIGLKLPSWRKMFAALTVNYNPSQSLMETKTKQGTLQRVGESENTALNAEKAFNDTEFITDTQNTNNGNTEQTDTYNLTETLTQTRGNAAENIQNEITLRQRNNLQLAILDAIVKDITLSIY